MNEPLSRRRAARFEPSPVFRKTALAIAVASVFTPAYADDSTSGWKRNVEIFVNPGSRRTIYGAQILQPVFQNANSLAYLDFRGNYVPNHDFKTNEFNLGAGYRRLTADNKWILGAYVAGDTREAAANGSRKNHRYQQITGGAEILGEIWDVRFNYYAPISDPNVVGSTDRGGVFQAHKLFSNGIVEEALEGFDGEVGALIPWIPFAETRIYLGAYHYDGDVAKSTTGVKGRLEMRLWQDTTLGVSTTSDDLFGGETMLTVRYSFGYSHKSERRTMSERMTQFVERDIDIKSTDGLPDGQMESGSPRFRALRRDDVVHIDNTATPGGDGTFEHPYDTFATCFAGSCTQTDNFVYVHAGDGTSFGYDQTFQMTAGQILWGQGANLFDIGGDQFPILDPSGGGEGPGADAIVLAQNNEVAGLRAENARNAVFGSDAGDFNIHDNQFVDSGYGVHIFNSGTDYTGTIANNLFENLSDHGIFIETQAENMDFSNTHILNITDNTLDDIGDFYGSDGISVYTVLDGASAGTQHINISNNTITGAEGDGIDIFSQTRGASTLDTTIDIVNNTISGSYDDGIDIDNRSTDGSVLSLHETINITGNTITGNETGIYIYSGASDGSTLTQTLDISNNVITDNTRQGIYIQNDLQDGSTGQQTLTISGNTITGNNGHGMYIRNDLDNGAVFNQTATLTGNTITGNDGVGIYIRNDADTDVVLTQTLDILDNAITGNGDEGLVMRNTVRDGSTVTQDAVLTNNVISANREDGIYLRNYASNDSTSTQRVILTNNTISDNTDNGIYARNIARNGLGTATQTLTLTGNSIIGNQRNGIYIRNFAEGDVATQGLDMSGGGNLVQGNDSYAVRAFNDDGGEGAVATQNINLRGTGNDFSGNGNGLFRIDGDDTQNVTLP